MQGFRDLPPASHSQDDARTSKAVEKELTVSGKRAKHMSLALALVRQFPGNTGREIFDLNSRTHYGGETSVFVDAAALTKRLSDLKHAELIRMGTPRQCRITNKTAATWHVVVQQTELF